MKNGNDEKIDKDQAAAFMVGVIVGILLAFIAMFFGILLGLPS